jgi:UDP-2,3-diacylglucosamine pyrophosphatase LpxH
VPPDTSAPETLSLVGPVRHALFFSDVHLGWAVCARHHAEWLRRLPAAVDDADLVVLNGDVLDGHRRPRTRVERALVQELEERVAGWRAEGRRVVYVEGNHDAHAGAGSSLRPECWSLDFETAEGARVRVLHGHRFSPDEVQWAAYDRMGRVVLAAENHLYGRVAGLRSLYRLGPGWLVSAVGLLECRLAGRALPVRVAPLLAGIDALVYGHIHYGPGRLRIGGLDAWRTGSWVSPGHLGTVDRMLRYRDGRFERIGWSGGRFRAFSDGR